MLWGVGSGFGSGSASVCSSRHQAVTNLPPAKQTLVEYCKCSSECAENLPEMSGKRFSIHIPGVVIIFKTVVLDRVKDFLPKIEAANRQLEEDIKRSGKAENQIDIDLVSSEKDVEDMDELSEKSSLPGNEQKKQPDIKLEFALGDFDNTPIAALEESESKCATNTEWVELKDDESDTETVHEIRVLKTQP